MHGGRPLKRFSTIFVSCRRGRSTRSPGFVLFRDFLAAHKTAARTEVGADFTCPACPAWIRGGASRLAKGLNGRHIVERFP
jgi:hypothetical protein